MLIINLTFLYINWWLKADHSSSINSISWAGVGLPCALNVWVRCTGLRSVPTGDLFSWFQDYSTGEMQVFLWNKTQSFHMESVPWDIPCINKSWWVCKKIPIKIQIKTSHNEIYPPKWTFLCEHSAIKNALIFISP